MNKKMNEFLRMMSFELILEDEMKWVRNLTYIRKKGKLEREKKKERFMKATQYFRFLKRWSGNPSLAIEILIFTLR